MAQVPEIRLMRERCVLCGDCIQLCPQSGKGSEHPVLVLENGEMRVDCRENCIACFTCVEYCRAAAIVIKRDSHSDEDQPEVLPSRQPSRII